MSYIREFEKINMGKDLCRKYGKYEKLKPQRQIFHDSWASVTKLVHVELLLKYYYLIITFYGLIQSK